MEEEGFKFFLWKLEAERAKGDELEIEQVVKKLSEGILRSAGIRYSTELEPDDKKTCY